MNTQKELKKRNKMRKTSITKALIKYLFIILEEKIFKIAKQICKWKVQTADKFLDKYALKMLNYIDYDDVWYYDIF